MEYRSFLDWYSHKNTLSIETKYTLEALLQASYTEDIKEANTRLQSRSELWLMDSEISDLSPLGCLTHLTKLELPSLKSKIRDLTPLKYLTNLTHLDITGSLITDISPLADLKNLNYLKLNCSRINDISTLQTLINLEYLELHGYEITNLQPLEKLHQLKEFRIYNSQVSDISYLKKPTNLTKVELINTFITDLTPLTNSINLIAFRYFNHLTTRDFTTPIKDIQILSKLVNLRILDLNNNEISDLTPLENSNSLRILNLSDNQIQDISPLSSLENLQILYLPNNQIEDISAISNLKKLRFLDLSNNPIKNISIIQELPKLTIRFDSELPLVITFQNWLKTTFDFNWLQDDEARWMYFDLEEWLEDMSPVTVIEYITETFNNSSQVLQDFSDEQINRGLWNLSLSCLYDDLYSLSNETISLELKQKCINSIFNLFQDLFLPRCSSALSHLDEAGLKPLNSVCYMWWDLRRDDLGQNRETIHREYIKIMEKILYLDSDACRESALHGLGHWYHGFPEQTETIIDRFLEKNPNLRTELKQYALNARIGCVL